MARAPNEAAFPGKAVPGVMTPRSNAPQVYPNMPTPAREAAYRVAPGNGAAINKTSVRIDKQAFKSRPGPGSNV